ncbi:Pre-rRNA-processing protein TSR2-domain-containing protein [Umbelopsis sp. PMI_123]|nr:Pre-rRNA-processing protein TSR2-domain-containing protein [Umbelopsis sp. PMI_123]
MVHPNQAAFTEGLNYVLQSWSALKLAVQQEWGGPDSAEKRDWMAETLIEYFGANAKKLDEFDIEDILVQIMSDEFHTDLEDGSAYAVSKHLVSMFNQCIHGDYSEVTKLREKVASRSYQPAGQSANNNEDSDDDDDDDDENEVDGEDDAMDVEEASAPQEPQGPIIDEDGFELVTKGRRRR